MLPDIEILVRSNEKRSLTEFTKSGMNLKPPSNTLSTDYKTNKLNYIRGLTDKTTSIVSLYPDFLYEFITQCFQRANSIREIIKK